MRETWGAVKDRRADMCVGVFPLEECKLEITRR